MPRFPLGEVLTVKHGFAFPGSEFSGDPSLPTVVTPGNFAIGGGFRETNPKTLVGEFPADFVLEAGALVVSMTDLSKGGDTLGLPAKIPSTGKYLHNQRIGLIKVLDPHRIDPDFLHYYLRTDGYRAHILGTASGSTVRHTSPSRIQSFLAVVPTLGEQRAIADALGALDNKIAANDRIGATARELARACYDEAVTGHGTVRMSAVLDPFLGGTPSRSDQGLWDGSVPWVSAKDICAAPHGVVIETTEGISQEAAATKRLAPLPAGTVVLTARGTVGEVARLGIASGINQSCYAFVPGPIPAACLGFVIEDASTQAKAMAHGSVFDTITMRTFDHVQVPAESGAQWGDIEARLAPLVAVTQQAVAESARLVSTRDKLLPLLMSGKVRVKDAETTVEGVL